ncbi:MAG: D-glycero-beta-D-manno-heptose-7-phosphate kinase [Candidatus Omnitrophica bacterium]|nr:D-glycero-beta-D-manno-heptose-7-phosphate kinase [Candidatus Omnitrophota bacterium]
MKQQSFSRLKKIISNFEKTKVLVIGDLILDEFIWGSVERISPEAPVPVVWVDKESYMPGGACNVANNIATLGGKAELVGVVGNDERGRLLKSELVKKGVAIDGIVVDDTRPTVLKSRVIAHKQQVVRIDKEVRDSISKEILTEVVNYVRERIKDIDILIIEDYGKGMITSQLLKRIVPLAKRHRKIIAVDPKEEHLSLYKGATLITPNADETFRATGIKLKDEKSIAEAGKKLLGKLGCKMALITLGEKGMALFKEGRKRLCIPTVAREVYDVSGAGDTVIGAFCLALASGASDVEAAYIANYAAGIVVSKIGIAVVEREELIGRIKEELARTKWKR